MLDLWKRRRPANEIGPGAWSDCLVMTLCTLESNSPRKRSCCMGIEKNWSIGRQSRPASPLSRHQQVGYFEWPICSGEDVSTRGKRPLWLCGSNISHGKFILWKCIPPPRDRIIKRCSACLPCSAFSSSIRVPSNSAQLMTGYGHSRIWPPETARLEKTMKLER